MSNKRRDQMINKCRWHTQIHELLLFIINFRKMISICETKTMEWMIQLLTAWVFILCVVCFLWCMVYVCLGMRRCCKSSNYNWNHLCTHTLSVHWPGIEILKSWNMYGFSENSFITIVRFTRIETWNRKIW